MARFIIPTFNFTLDNHTFYTNQDEHISFNTIAPDGIHSIDALIDSFKTLKVSSASFSPSTNCDFIVWSHTKDNVLMKIEFKQDASKAITFINNHTLNDFLYNDKLYLTPTNLYGAESITGSFGILISASNGSSKTITIESANQRSVVFELDEELPFCITPVEVKIEADSTEMPKAVYRIYAGDTTENLIWENDDTNYNPPWGWGPQTFGNYSEEDRFDADGADLGPIQKKLSYQKKFRFDIVTSGYYFPQGTELYFAIKYFQNSKGKNRVYNNSVITNCTAYYYDGTSFVQCEPLFHDGNTWRIIR